MMTTMVKESIETLKKVQEIDREIYQSLQRLKEIPEERAQGKREFELEKNRLAELDQALKKLQLKQKQKEGELAQKEAHIKRLDGQLSQVKTNKEYSALQQELASLKADNSLLEEEIIRILDEVEAAEEEVEKEKENLKQIERQFAVRDQERAEKEKVLRESLEVQKKLRQEVIQQVPPEIRERYDLIVQKKQGIGLVKVKGENCGACQLLLRPQILNELRSHSAIVLCENCSRILYLEE